VFEVPVWLLRILQGPLTIQSGNLTIQAGKLVLPTGGAADTAGTATLNGGSPGTVTVPTTAVAAGSKIMLSRKTISGTAGFLTYTISAGVSFTITSSANTDAGQVDWTIVN